MNLYDTKEDTLCDLMRIAYYVYNSCKTTDGTEVSFFEDCRSGLPACNCLTLSACIKIHAAICKTSRHGIDIKSIAEKTGKNPGGIDYIRQVYANKLVHCQRTQTNGVKTKIAYYELHGHNAISMLIDQATYDGAWLERDALGLICLLHCYIDIYIQIYIYGYPLTGVELTNAHLKNTVFKQMCNCLMAMFVDEDTALHKYIEDIRQKHVYASLFAYTHTFKNLQYKNDATIVAATWACIQRAITYLTANSVAYINQSAYTWFNALYDFWQN